MINLEFLTEEIEEVIEGQCAEIDNEEYNIFILKLKNNIYILYFNIIDLITKEIKYSNMKEFDDLEMAQEEYKFIKIEIN